MRIHRFYREKRQRTRVVLGIGIVGGILTALFFALFRPNPPSTFGVFYFAAKASMSGDVVYHTKHGLWTYTPASLLYFYPYTILFDFETARFVHRVLSVPVAVFYGVVLARFIGRNADIDILDKLLIVGFTSASVYPVVNVVNASFVGMFTACLGIGWILLESDKDSGGVAWALASLVKGFPAFWGAYLLRVRRWRATAAAILTGVSATIIGILVFGFEAYIRFFTIAGTSRVRYHMFRGGKSPDNEAMTPLRALAQIFPDVDPSLFTPTIIVVVVALTLFIYYAVPTSTLNDRSTLLLATIIGVIFIMPTSQDMDTYLVYAPVLTLLYIERDAFIQGLYLTGILFISFNFSQNELEPVLSVFDPRVVDATMYFADPFLTFAKMPMYGIYLFYIGCLVYALNRGRETGRLEWLGRRLLVSYRSN